MNDIENGPHAEYYTRGLVAGHRRLFYLSQRAVTESLDTAESLVLFYGEMGMDGLEAYYTGIRDVLSDAVEEWTEIEIDGPFLDDYDFGDADDPGIMRWERLLSGINLAVLALIGFVIFAVVFYWRAPDF